MNIETRIETLRTDLEKEMMSINSELSTPERQLYLQGWIDCLARYSHISEEERDILQLEYVD